MIFGLVGKEAIKDWAALTPDEKKLFARQMEVTVMHSDYFLRGAANQVSWPSRALV